MTSMIVLAAGRGTRLAPLTDDRPKCLVEVAGRPLLAWSLHAAAECGLGTPVLVGGYLADSLASQDATVVVNERYETTNMVTSLLCAKDQMGGGFVMSYGDIAYTPDVLRALLDSPGPIAVVVDMEWESYWRQRFTDPMSDAESLTLTPEGMITSIGQDVADVDEIDAQYIGLVRIDADAVPAFLSAADDLRRERGEQIYMTDVLHRLASQDPGLRAVPIRRGWVEVDSPGDLRVADAVVRQWELT